ncbi:hypothetical protein A8990_14814 [Paenibacillus taihuensis]|uniref:Uncharacterized protein n=1 Tax=Paenibacillus taihuensis TaxID=1156355 RepID=A0A3D9R0U1_9BACL|nr:hypothetical protein [Paenibacillus taihuensis]REE66678.1 hypothetical protein A8990_14814 [Paenibacillus taihuensis]
MLRTMWREERGSALLLVVFMILLFAMLGVAVLGATIGGATRAQKSEDNLQTVHLADKALSEAVAHIMAQFNDQSINPTQITQQAEDFVGKFNDYSWRDNSDLDKAKSPEYQIKNICLLDVPSDISKQGLYCADHQTADNPASGNETTYLTSLRVTAEAVVNGVKRDLTQEVTLDTFPDFLKYSMGSEGNVNVNGAPLFIGSIYAGTQLSIRNAANYVYHSNQNLADTQYLYVVPSDNTTPINELFDDNGDPIESGKIQIQTDSTVQYYIGDSPTSQDLPQNSQSPQFHGLEPQIEFSEKKKFISIEVPDTFVDKAFDALGADGTVDYMLRDALMHAYDDHPINPADELLNLLRDYFRTIYSNQNRVLTVPSKPAAGASDEDVTLYHQAMSKLNDSLSHLSGPLYIDGDLTIGKDGLSKIYYDHEKTVNDWLVVNGDLTIDNDDPNTTIPIRANILVKGNIHLAGKLEMDSTIYSLIDSKTSKNEIADAQIRGLTINGVKRELVMIANSPIDIYRVDSFQNLDPGGYSKDSPNTLDAFFYTDKEAELYGVGSLFWLHGGFFAKDGMTINAVLGNTSQVPNQNTLQFEPQDEADGLNLKNARFVIDYDRDMFKTQGVGLPRVNKVRVHIGQKKLVPAS